MARIRLGKKFSNASDLRSWKKKKKKSKKKKLRRSSYKAHKRLPNIYRLDVDFLSDLVHGGHYPYPYPYEEEDMDLDDEIPHDDLDDEVMFGTIRTAIVGVQYYKGMVNSNEMVCLEREPQNLYDRNAIKVLNLDRVQVGHLKRDMARALSIILDNNLARLEGSVPFGARGVYTITVDLTVWGKPEYRQKTNDILKSHGVHMKPVGGSVPGKSSSSQFRGFTLGVDYSHVITQREFLSPADVNNELDKLFESLEEGDKTTMTQPAEAIQSTLYPHQKQALNWMVSQENEEKLPPFWEKRGNGYFNSLTVSTSTNKPSSIMGGILADDMGLGKTLVMISLILTNFVNKQPLARPVPGKVRVSKQHSQLVKKKSSETSKRNKTSKKKGHYKKACTFEKLHSTGVKIHDLENDGSSSGSSIFEISGTQKLKQSNSTSVQETINLVSDEEGDTDEQHDNAGNKRSKKKRRL